MGRNWNITMLQVLYDFPQGWDHTHFRDTGEYLMLIDQAHGDMLQIHDRLIFDFYHMRPAQWVTLHNI